VNLAASLILPDDKEIHIAVREGSLASTLYRLDEIEETNATSIFKGEEEVDWTHPPISISNMTCYLLN